MESLRITQIIKILNALDVLGIGIILFIAFLLQFTLKELPCPLCILQRIGMLGIAFGFLLNVRYKIHPGHYTLSLLATVLTAFIALRQIVLHIIPGTGAYGAPILGLHLYTWVFILCVVAIVYISLLLSVSLQYHGRIERKPHRAFRILSYCAFVLLLGMAISNAISTYLECGFAECPDNPITYQAYKL